jgi:hypothetical protein
MTECGLLLAHLLGGLNMNRHLLVGDYYVIRQNQRTEAKERKIGRGHEEED